MSLNEWTVKQTVLHPYHGLLVNNKKKQSVDTYDNLAGSSEIYAEWKNKTKQNKKPVSKDYMLYNFIYITFLKWQNFRNGEQICGYQGLRRVAGGREVVRV